MADLMKVAMELVTAYSARVHSPNPLHVFRSSDVETAFRFLQSGKNPGKAVIEIHGDDMVRVSKDSELLELMIDLDFQTVPSTRPSWHFDENATYVIAGGLGGLGRSIARRMGTRKAKRLMLLSCSGARGEAALTLLQELEAKIVVSCVGILVEPSAWPTSIPGRQNFREQIFHSSR